ncbi:CBS domain-containing protein [Streptosporangium sp. NPDC000239]|uniref:CBS domain-containing protein n=1 Tax=Streptosporangium sp. NPDC000239 TaxID=3154248 RepID=UPI00332FF21A
MRVNVGDVMTRTVVSVSGDTSCKDVAEALVAHGVSAVPVLDADGHVIGVVSEADLLLKQELKDRYHHEERRPASRTRPSHPIGLGENGERTHENTAADVMTSPAVTVEPQQATAYAMRLMDANGIKRLPVVDRRGRLVGIVSRRDLLKILIRPDADIAREIQEDVLGRYPRQDASTISLSVDRGIVRLTGRVKRRSDARITAHMATMTNGVLDVIDELKWDEDDAPAPQDR